MVNQHFKASFNWPNQQPQRWESDAIWSRHRKQTNGSDASTLSSSTVVSRRRSQLKAMNDLGLTSKPSNVLTGPEPSNARSERFSPLTETCLKILSSIRCFPYHRTYHAAAKIYWEHRGMVGKFTPNHYQLRSTIVRSSVSPPSLSIMCLLS